MSGHPMGPYHGGHPQNVPAPQFDPLPTPTTIRAPAPPPSLAVSLQPQPANMVEWTVPVEMPRISAMPSAQVTMRIKHIVMHQNSHPPLNKAILSRKPGQQGPGVPAGANFEDQLKRLYGLANPSLATHYAPEAHPARSVCFGDKGCIAYVYPTGRIVAQGMEVGEAAVRETARKTLHLASCVFGTVLKADELLVESITLGVPACPVLHACLASDPLFFDKTSLRFTSEATFCPEVVPALGIRIPRSVGHGASALLFESGSLLLSGLRTREQGETLYKYVRGRYLAPYLAAGPKALGASGSGSSAASAAVSALAGVTGAGAAPKPTAEPSSGPAREQEEEEEDDDEDEEDGNGDEGSEDEEEGDFDAPVPPGDSDAEDGGPGQKAGPRPAGGKGPRASTAPAAPPPPRERTVRKSAAAALASREGYDFDDFDDGDDDYDGPKRKKVKR